MSVSYCVLLVEDEDDDVVMLTQLIENIMHYDVAVARDGLDAIRMARNRIFDLVLLDLRLPNLQGFEVVEALRQLVDYRDVPIIALTAYDLADTRDHSLESGCNEYLTKPIDIDRFIQIVSDYLPAVA